MGVLDSKVVVITGGSLGIGREVAKKCAFEGATVVIGARGEEDLIKTLEELNKIANKPHKFYAVDVGKSEEVKGFARFCSEQFSELHGLVNCAGVYGPIGKTTEVDMEEFAAAIQINFLGTVLMCHAFAPLLKGVNGYSLLVNGWKAEDGGRRSEDRGQEKRQGVNGSSISQITNQQITNNSTTRYAGQAPSEQRTVFDGPDAKAKGRKKIINYSGGGAAGPFPHFSAYATSKVAIVRFTENLSAELADEGFDVNCIAPGFVVTRLHQETLEAGPERATTSFFENTKKQMESGGTPPGRAANLTLFLLSDASNGITGKFLSAPWDSWEDKEFQERLRNDKDFATLRRIDDKMFFKRE